MATATLPISRSVQILKGRLATTPGRLWLAVAGVWVLALVFFLAVLAGVRQQRQGLQTIGVDSAPSIIAAQGIKSSLADMHASAARFLLGKPSSEAAAAKLYESRRLEATEALLAAAGNITYGEDERVPLRTLMNNLGKYEAAVAQARLLHERGDAGFLTPYRAADEVLHGTLLVAADKLDEANRRHLEAAYTSDASAAHWAWVGILVATLALLAVLVHTQLYLYRRMRRVFNPGLFAASVLLLGFLVATFTALVGEQRSLKVAKKDAFDSIDFLSQARAVAYDANGDLRRMLLDPEHAAAHWKDFAARADRLVKLPDRAEGYLPQELGNITFAGEREAAQATMNEYLTYRALAARVEELAGKGQGDEARTMELGDQPNQAGGVFARFDKALADTLKINQTEFDRAVAAGFADVAHVEVWAALVALGIALLASLGLRPRLKEYAA
jgi:hypothetical protein